jgi:hypothetical protein
LAESLTQSTAPHPIPHIIEQNGATDHTCGFENILLSFVLHVSADTKAISGISLKTNVKENACKQILLIKIIKISIVFVNIKPVRVAR